MTLTVSYQKIKDTSISGRYFPPGKLEHILSKYNSVYQIAIPGTSEEKRNIYSVKIGRGPRKVLMWSQMHGNETTTTKAVVDFLAFMKTFSERQQQYLNEFTFLILPILNPDGAKRYTRENANKVDLNRDAFEKTQSEMKLLHAVFEEFKPDLCLNLHDQRTIFSVGNTPQSATLSFLSPAADADKTITPSRKMVMELIAAVYKSFDAEFQQKIGRFDDSYNRNCIGDTFQSFNVPTILLEAGHFPEDYLREVTREKVFLGLINLFDNYLNNRVSTTYKDYFQIPENTKNFCDVLITNALLENSETAVDIEIQFKEVLSSETIDFVPEVIKISKKSNLFGHKIIDAKNKKVCLSEKRIVEVGMIFNYFYINSEKHAIF